MALRSAPERLQRLLVMLPWLMEVGEAPVAEVARRFDLTEGEVEENLELVAMCGLPPFVDEMIDVFIDDGTVYVGVPRLFTRPLRLTAPEAFALLAAARTAMELPGARPDGPLGRGLGKLAAALDEVGVGGSDDSTAGVVVELGASTYSDELVDHVAAGAEIEISYYSPDRDVVSERTIVPRHVFVDAGHWYVLADDYLSGDRRTFRVDRIERIRPTGKVVPVSGEVVTLPPFFVDADLDRAVLRLDPTAAWIAEQYPVDSVVVCAEPAGWIEVRLPVASSRWLSRVLIRLGPHVVVVEPAAARVDARLLAARILDRYSG